jgi:hypothetical protein
MDRVSKKINNDLRVITVSNSSSDPITTVFFKFIPVVKFNSHSRAERRVAAVALVEQGICDQQTAGTICGFHRNTVSKLKSIKASFGITAIISDNRGLKQPLKYSGKVRETIEQILTAHPTWKDYQVANQASTELNDAISRSAVARIRISQQATDNEDILYSQDRMQHLIQIAKTVDEDNNGDRQLTLNLANDDQFKQQTAEFEQNEAPRSSLKSEQDLIKRLQTGERTPFAGGFMHHLFLQEINYDNLMSCLPTIKGNTYQYQDMLSTLYFSIANDVKSIESLKLINSSCLGTLIGKSRAPDKDVIRNHLNSLSAANFSSDLIDHFAKILLEQHRIDREVFFIDGHFLPYYGLHVIAKGYYTVRRLAMKGNELYVISDLQGRPLFFITESNDIDFRPIISRAADKLIELGISRPLLTFDRGGYGIQFFSELAKKADFVTWAKYLSDKQLDAISEDRFNQCLAFGEKKYLIADQQRTVTESIQTAKRDGRTQATQMQLRLVVIADMASETRIGIYSNNNQKSAGDIAYYMLSRWGDSENLYKELMAKFNLNYHPGYDIEQLKEQPLVDNPDMAMIREAIGILKNETDKLNNDIDDIQTRLSKRQDKRLDSKLIKLNQQLEQNNEDVINFSEKLKTLPEKISIVELLQGKKMSRCDLEKKKLYDFMQSMVLHSYERLKELFKTYYKDHRDIKQVLRMITQKSGFLKLTGDTLIVLLDKIELKKHRIAAEQLCRELNSIRLTLIGPVKMKLFFYVSKF